MGTHESSGGSGDNRAGVWRVLLVENHADTRLSVRIFLESLGYEVEEAADGAEARVRAERGVFDVLLSDINLPDDDGRGLLLWLGERGRRPRRAIAMSGMGGADEQLRSHAAGYERHLVKPFVAGELQDALASLGSAPGVPVARDGAVDAAAVVVARPPEAEGSARLAQRIHDDLCQQLAAAAMWQGMLIRKLENLTPPSRPLERAMEEARQVSRLLDGALTEARALMRELRGDVAS